MPEASEQAYGDATAARRWHAVLDHRERLLRIAVARTSSLDEAEDCVQEAMLRCVEYVDLDEDRLGAFLTSTTMRLCADGHRERIRQVQIGQRLAVRTGREADVEDAVCERAEAQWVARHAARLPARQRAVLAARAEGLPLTEVAARCGLSFKAAESAIARARARLRALLATTFGLACVLGRRRPVTAGPAVLVPVTLLAAATVVVTQPPTPSPGVHRPAAPPGAVRVTGQLQRVAVAAGTPEPRPWPTAVRGRPPATDPAPVLDAGLVSVRRGESPPSPVDAVEHCYGYGVHAAADVSAVVPHLVLPSLPPVTVCAHLTPPSSPSADIR